MVRGMWLGLGEQILSDESHMQNTNVEFLIFMKNIYRQHIIADKLAYENYSA